MILDTKLIKHMLSIICQFVVMLHCNGQIVSIDKFDTANYAKKATWNYQLSTGLEIDKQQQVLYDATNTAELSLQKCKNLYLLSSSYRFTYNGPTDILNAGYFHLRFRHNYKHKIQPEGFVQYQWDNKRGLESRFLLGANIRYNAWHADVWDLNAGLGLMYEKEVWNYDGADSTKLPTDLTPIVNNLLKLNSYIRLDWKASDHSNIAFKVFLQAAPKDFSPRLAPNIQWNVDAGKHLGFSINFNGMYDVNPVVPIPKFYFSISNSLYYKL